MFWGPLADCSKAPPTISWWEVGKGTVEVLIMGVIKGQVFFGIGVCFIATARFLFFFDKSADVKCWHWCFNTELAVWWTQLLCSQLKDAGQGPVLWEAPDVWVPKCWGGEAVPAIVCMYHTVIKDCSYQTAAMGTWTVLAQSRDFSEVVSP